MNSDLLGSLAGGYAMLGDVTNSNSGQLSVSHHFKPTGLRVTI